MAPVPFDKTSTWLKGSDKGPDAIIEASAYLELYDIETKSEVYKKGVHTASPLINSTPESMVKSVHESVLSKLNDDKFVVVVGGEHSVSIGSIQAHSDYYEKLSVLQLDAHSDLRNEYEGSEFNHACIIIEMLSAGPRECCLNLASARPFGGIWGLFKMLRIGLPQGLDGRVEQPLAKAVCLLDCLEQCLPFWGELMEPSLAIELTELGMWVVETEDLF